MLPCSFTSIIKIEFSTLQIFLTAVWCIHRHYSCFPWPHLSSFCCSALRKVKWRPSLLKRQKCSVQTWMVQYSAMLSCCSFCPPICSRTTALPRVYRAVFCLLSALRGGKRSLGCCSVPVRGDGPAGLCHACLVCPGFPTSTAASLAWAGLPPTSRALLPRRVPLLK